MKEKVVATVILYEPLPSVKYNILSYIDDIDYLYIVDNSRYRSSVIFELAPYSYKIKVLHYGKNIGVASALNLAIARAKEDNYKWLFTFDQDTYFEGNECSLFLENLFSLKLNNQVAIVSPLHNKKFINKNKPLVSNIDFVMTSANCINVDIAYSLGGFDEKLFIDEVDHEFCLRLKKYNYIIYINNHISVKHKLGVSHKLFSKVKIYPSLRLYYMIRNYLYIRRLYKIYNIDFFKNRDKYLVKFFVYQLIFGDNIKDNIFYIVKGIKDYSKNRFGKLKKYE